MKLRKFFRRTAFFVLFLCSIWAIALQTGCFSMRSPDKTWVKKMKAQSQSIEPIFLDVPDKAGRKIHAVCIQASDSLPLVVFLHGSPGASDAFVDYLADTSLSKKARLVALDRPGFGYTDNFGKPEPSMAAQADAVRAIVEALSPQQKVILVGHSLGGPVIARFAMDYPERTAGLVLLPDRLIPDRKNTPGGKPQWINHHLNG